MNDERGKRLRYSCGKLEKEFQPVHRDGFLDWEEGLSHLRSGTANLAGYHREEYRVEGRRVVRSTPKQTPMPFSLR